MKQRISRARIVHIHRAVAIVSIILIVFVAISGILLQHAEDLGWHKKTIHLNWQLDLYKVPASHATAWHIANSHQQQAIQLGFLWYLQDHKINHDDLKLKGAAWIEPLWILADERNLYLYDEHYQPVETIPLNFPVSKIGVYQQKLVIQSNAAFYQADENLIEFNQTDVKAQIDWSVIEPLQSKLAQKLPQRVSNITYLKLMQDLHGGRLWGLPHWLIPDLTAFALLFLSLSGVMMKWQRRPRKKKRKILPK